MSENGYALVPTAFCAACGEQDTLVLAVRDLPFEYRGQSTLIRAVHGQFCTACGEGLADPAHPEDWLRLNDEIQVFTQQINAALAAEMRTIRRKLGLRQAEAGKLFGGGISAFSEYERGKTQPHKSTVLLLRLINHHPELLEELRG
ncbi:MAG: type II TA system antitoxin MqsA family protein [Gallionella sp.]